MIRGLDRWLASWLFRRRTRVPAERHLLIAICDHFEPFHGADKTSALARVAHWRSEYSRMTAEFRDSGGVARRHVFYPIEQWDDDVCRAIAGLCAATGGEMEIHLHHENDTAETLRRTLIEGKERLANLGQLSRDTEERIRYCFVHGNWALAHSHPEGRHCGVPDELGVLSETGCIADFTLPSAPSPCQVKTINSIYRADQFPGRPRSHERGWPLKVGGSYSRNGHQFAAHPGTLGVELALAKVGGSAPH